jgi:hypothetical protein
LHKLDKDGVKIAASTESQEPLLLWAERFLAACEGTLPSWMAFKEEMISVFGEGCMDDLEAKSKCQTLLVKTSTLRTPPPLLPSQRPSLPPQTQPCDADVSQTVTGAEAAAVPMVQMHLDDVSE